MSPEEIKIWADLAPVIATAFAAIAGVIVKWVLPTMKFFKTWRAERDNGHAELLQRLDGVAVQLQSHTEQIDAHTADIATIRTRCIAEARRSMASVP